MGFLNLLMLFGLAATVIPIIIHLLSRRRFEVVDWGAMQFLQVSETTRRRLFLEELLLLLMRMGLIAVLVLGLALPYTTSQVLARVSGRPSRDVVLVFDGSYSMGESGTGKSAHELAKEWAHQFVEGLSAGDSVAILQAKQQVVPVLPEPTHDLERVRDRITTLPGPRGGCDWQQALQAAHQILAKSTRPQREIILLSDNQRFGWADENSLLRWELLSNQLLKQRQLLPRTWVVNLAPERPADPPNWTLEPIRASRAVASTGQQITFRTGLRLLGQTTYRPPYRLRLEVNGQPAGDLVAPQSAKLDKGQAPLSFRHRFTQAGSHLVTVIVEPDPPIDQRPADYVVKDSLPGDNRQDFAVEVLPALPVLLVDGDTTVDPRRRGTDFLRDALAPARDLTPVVTARVVPIQEFTPELLTDMKPTPRPGEEVKPTRPRVLILSNVAMLTEKQQEAVTEFLASGGGVLVTLGERVDAAHYNELLFKDGQGWLPARLEDVAGDETKLATAPSPLPSSFFHPALDLFRDVQLGGLGNARLPRWWKLTTPGRDANAVPVALLNNNDPFLVEKTYRGGRVLLCSVPLDSSWRTNLPDLLEFAPLAHELIYYLAGARSAEVNVQPGQPLRYRLEGDAKEEGFTLQPPEGDPRPVRIGEDGRKDDAIAAQLLKLPQGQVLVLDDTRETGVYRLRTPDEKTIYYTVQPDLRESDLAPNQETDREKVAELVPMEYRDSAAEVQQAVATSAQQQELWWLFLVGMIGLLCGEVWMTRRLVRGG